MGKKRIIKPSEEEVMKGTPEGGKSSSADGAKIAVKSMQTVPHGRIYIRASYNNVLVNATDEKGNILAWASSGAAGFKGPKKATPFAAAKSVENLFSKLGRISFGDISIYIYGIGGGRDSALRAIVGRGIPVASIRDISPLPHNGCRPKKVRRV